jgi:hypothetical protein
MNSIPQPSQGAAVVVHSQVFASIRRQHGSFDTTPCEGLLGLAWSTIAKSGEATFFDNVCQQGLVKHEIFSVYLTDHGQAGSEICFGCYDETNVIAPTVTSWIPLIAQVSAYMHPNAHSVFESYWALVLIGILRRIGRSDWTLSRSTAVVRHP